MNIEVPPDKQKLYKILIEKNYNEHPLKEEKKKPVPVAVKSNMLQRMSTSVGNYSKNKIGKELEKEKKRIMVDAAKKF